jgi:hypothetical protein
MEKHNPVPLTATERVDLGSITRHPGMTVLLEKIIGTHMRGQLEMVHNVQPDDPHRVTKIDGICAVANGMKLTYELAKREIERNWKILEEQEVQRQREVKNEMELTQ